MSSFQKAKKLILRFASFIFACMLLYLLYRLNLLDTANFTEIPMRAILACVIFGFVQTWLVSWRLAILFRSVSVRLEILDAFILNCIGLFYTLFLPGSLSGDVVKVLYFKRLTHASLSKTTVTLILDKVLGLFSVVFIGIVFSYTLWPKLQNLHGIGFLYIAVIGFLVVGILMCVLFFKFCALDSPPKVPGGAAIFEWLKGLRSNKYSAGTLVAALALGGISQLITIVSILIISNCLNSGLSFLTIAAILPFGVLANLIPISPGGLGVGEYTIEYLFSMFGGTHGALIFLIVRICLYAPALIGAYFVFKKLLMQSSPP